MPGRGEGDRLKSNVVFPLFRLPVRSRCRLPLVRKEFQTQSAVSLYAGVLVFCNAIQPLLSVEGAPAVRIVSDIALTAFPAGWAGF